MKKWIVILMAVAAAGFGTYKKWPDWKPEATGETSNGRPRTAAVETRTIHFAVSAAGEIGPAEQVSVRPEVHGMIATLPVDIGDTVKEGQVLFTLDDRDLKTELATRKAEIDGAKIQLEKADRDFRRAQELFGSKLISQELFEDTKTEAELAKNALDRALQALALTNYRLTKTRIMAPFDCTVLTRPVSVGQAVSGSGGFNSGTEVLTIADLNRMIVNAHVNQADVTRLTQRQEVEIAVESVPGLAMKGTVERIAPQSAIKNGVKGYAARILIQGIDPRVRPGMTANISIPVASAEHTVAVPLAAVFTEQGERFVYVQSDAANDEFEKRPVRVGIADYDYAEVLTGLKAGEIVSLEDPASGSTKVLANGQSGLAHQPPRPGGGLGTRPAGEQRPSGPALAANTGTNAPGNLRTAPDAAANRVPAATTR
ncbi:MAG: efflux RND transporter periplasmic adaptor subunit [Verrucomicrobiales bacterium]|nr:efflux RND transporter periplasmic adaptor subunit [Verrucomicrobiales bacterium]